MLGEVPVEPAIQNGAAHPPLTRLPGLQRRGEKERFQISRLRRPSSGERVVYVIEAGGGPPGGPAQPRAAPTAQASPPRRRSTK